MFGSLFGKKSDNSPSGQLAIRLGRYPGWHVPHLGTNGATLRATAPVLTIEALRDNLHAYVAAMPERLATVGALLRRKRSRHGGRL